MNLINRIIICSITMVATILVYTQVWADLKFEPSTSTIGVGDSISVNIIIDGLESLNLTTFQFDITYDETKLSIDSYSFGTGLGMTEDYVDISIGTLSLSGPGNYDLSQFSWLEDFSSQADSFILATLNITGLGLGESTLGFDHVFLSDEFGDSIAFTSTGGSLTVNAPVPEPTSILLCGTGALALAGFRLRSRSKKKSAV